MKTSKKSIFISYLHICLHCFFIPSW